MSNTKVTIEYADGQTRTFEASDALEEQILEGHFFSVSTMLSDIHIDEEISLSKMYSGNPVAAMGMVLKMRKNAVGIIGELEDNVANSEEINKLNVVISTLDAALRIMSDEFTTGPQAPMAGANGVDVGANHGG